MRDLEIPTRRRIKASVSLDRDLFVLMERETKQKGIARSAILNRALWEYFKQQGGAKDKAPSPEPDG